MEAAFRAHPLWSGSSEEQLDNAADVRSTSLSLVFLSIFFPSLFLIIAPFCVYIHRDLRSMS